jgi:Flp pilus assembly protein TadG
MMIKRALRVFGRHRHAVRQAAVCTSKRLARCERGNIAIISAIVLPVLLAAFGLGFETSDWYYTERSMQNAADSAAVAAATNGTSSYASEANAVAATYGFTGGVNGVTVTDSNTATCPSGATNCYSVTITKPVWLYLSQLVGYQGDTTYEGGLAKTVRAVAIAVQGTTPHQYCLLALASSGLAGITGNGVPKANLNGCNIMSNTSATCNGHNLNAGYGDAHGQSTGCGTVQDSNVPVVADPYVGLASNIPANPCSSYPQEPVKKKDPALPLSNQLSGSLNWSGTTILCGDVQLTGNVDLTTSSPGAVLVIENGQLDTNGYTLQTQANSGLTVIFTGTSASGYTHAPTGGGTLDIAAPTSGTWSGVAMYQDPNLTSGMDISAAGNSPTWDITGLVYLPHSSVTFSGAVNKSTNGLSCFDLVVDNITINGTGSILSEGQCNQAGLDMPTGEIPSRGELVS